MTEPERPDPFPFWPEPKDRPDEAPALVITTRRPGPRHVGGGLDGPQFTHRKPAPPPVAEVDQ